MYQAERRKIQTFTDLNAWKEGHAMVLYVYEVTDNFPSSQRFSLVNQIQRAAVSVTSNIAEGFSRNSNKEKINFYYISLGSLTEMQNQILIAKDLHFCSEESYQKIADQSIIVSKLVNGLIKSLKLRGGQHTT